MQHSALTLLGLFLLAGVITGCNDNSKTPTTSNSVVQIKKFQQPTVLEGKVSNGKALFKSGNIEATDEEGRVLAKTSVDNGHYKIEIPAGTFLPVLLNYQSEDGEIQLMTAVVYDSIHKYFIDPSTTAIAKKAKAMGGYTRSNMARAAEETVHTPDANKTSSGWRGDPTTQYGGWH